MSELPSGWATATVADLGSPGERAVLTGPFGSHLSSSDFTSSGVPVLTIGCLTDGGVSLAKAMHVSREKAEELGRYRLGVGDMLFSRMASVGRAGFVTEALEGALFNYHLMRLRLDPASYLPNLFLAFVRGAPEVRQYLDEVNHGATRDGINTEQLLGMPVLVPPLNEQRRIVEKLDAVFEKSRAAKARLERLPALLQKLKRSILAAAFRGDLTKDWRAANPNVEPATVLAKRLADARRSGQGTPRNARVAGASSSAASSKEADVPGTWLRATLADVAEIQLGQRRAPEYVGEDEFPYVRAANITWRGLDLADVKTMGFANPEPLFLRPGDVVLNEASGSPTEVGKPALWRGELDRCCIQATVLRLRSWSVDVLGEWLYYCCLHDALLGKFIEMAPGVGILHLTADRMRKWPLVVPPLGEQVAVIEKLRTALAELYRQEDLARLHAERWTRFEQATLAKAFRGELVPQDPSDETASVLLERIHGARTAEPRPRGRPARPAEPQLFATPAASSKGAAAASDAVIEVFRTSSRQTATGLGTATGLDAATVKKALKALVDAGKVRVEGKARGTAYVWSATG